MCHLDLRSRNIGDALDSYGSTLTSEQRKVFEIVMKGYVGYSRSVLCRMYSSQEMQVRGRATFYVFLWTLSKNRWGKRKSS